MVLVLVRGDGVTTWELLARVSSAREVEGVNAAMDRGEMVAAAMERMALEYLMVQEKKRRETASS